MIHFIDIYDIMMGKGEGMCVMGKTAKLLLACLLVFALVLSGQVSAAATEQTETAAEAIRCAGFDGAVAVLREQMVQRQPVVAVSFEWDNAESQIMKDVFNAALSHTGVPKEGDYLYWHMKKCSMQMLAQPLDDERYELTLTYTLTYRSTAEQEAQVDVAVQTLLDQLDVYGAGDYEKVCAIYDYICENVKYDNTGLLFGDEKVFTAYAALIRKAAVCQGYASLFYRLALELDVDTRVISGTSKQRAHGWNIVRLNGKYYNLDSTWDATCAQNGQLYQYFLRCDADFTEHSRDEAYSTELFYKTYPMANTNYDATALPLRGDLTGDGQVDEDDAIYLLQHVLMPGDFPVEQTADLDRNGRVDEEDAIYLLQYILMPEYFPLKQ